jgi:glutaredoxin
VYDTLLAGSGSSVVDVVTPRQKTGPAKLFIKSVRLPIATYEVHDVPGHYCQDGYRTKSTIISLSPEDKQAREILTRSGVRFEVIDISEGRGGGKLVAWYRRVRKTPTLWAGGGHHRKYEGVRAISEYVTAQSTVA